MKTILLLSSASEQHSIVLPSSVRCFYYMFISTTKDRKIVSPSHVYNHRTLMPSLILQSLSVMSFNLSQKTPVVYCDYRPCIQVVGNVQDNSLAPSSSRSSDSGESKCCVPASTERTQIKNLVYSHMYASCCPKTPSSHYLFHFCARQRVKALIQYFLKQH